MVKLRWDVRTFGLTRPLTLLLSFHRLQPVAHAI
jgi:hypothetical protein